MLRCARELGLPTLGYAKTPVEPDALLAMGVERVRSDIGCNFGGSQSMPGGAPLDHAAEQVRRALLHKWP